jgi:hypothetical protein
MALWKMTPWKGQEVLLDDQEYENVMDARIIMTFWLVATISGAMGLHMFWPTNMAYLVGAVAATIVTVLMRRLIVPLVVLSFGLGILAAICGIVYWLAVNVTWF